MAGETNVEEVGRTPNLSRLLWPTDKPLYQRPLAWFGGIAAGVLVLWIMDVADPMAKLGDLELTDEDFGFGPESEEEE